MEERVTFLDCATLGSGADRESGQEVGRSSLNKYTNCLCSAGTYRCSLYPEPGCPRCWGTQLPATLLSGSTSSPVPRDHPVPRNREAQPSPGQQRVAIKRVSP